MATVRESLIAGEVRTWAGTNDLENITPPPLAVMTTRLAGKLIVEELKRVDKPPIRKTKGRTNGGFPDPIEVEINLGKPVARWDINRVYRYVMGMF